MLMRSDLLLLGLRGMWVWLAGGLVSLRKRPRVRTLAGGVVAVAALLTLAGCKHPQLRYVDSPGVPRPARVASGALLEGDLVRIVFEGETNMNTMVKVQLDGTITMPLVGKVLAAGRLPQEVQAELAQQYERLLKVNEITLTVANTAASVYVSGAVLRPGRIPMDRPLTALDAIMEAGGLNERARPSRVRVLRIEDDRQLQFRLDVRKMLEGSETMPFFLKPFDIIHVPERSFNF